MLVFLLKRVETRSDSTTQRSIECSVAPVHGEEGGDAVVPEQQQGGQPALQQTLVSMEPCSKHTAHLYHLLFCQYITNHVGIKRL